MVKGIAKKAYERSQNITLVNMPAVRPGAYRIVNDVVLEDGEGRTRQPISGTRMKAKK